MASASHTLTRAVRGGPPEEVQRLVTERSVARDARDYARADALRDEIHALGWEVQDARDGTTVRPALPSASAPTGYVDPGALESLLDEPATVDLSVHLLAEDHPDDLRRCLRALRRHPTSVSWELVVVANAPSFNAEAAVDEEFSDNSERAAPQKRVGPQERTILRTAERLGWADAVNLGLRRSRGSVTLLLNTSVEPTGDIATPLIAAFAEASVGIAGGWGVTSPTGRHFHEAPPGEVDAVEAYALGIRREALRAVGGFDHRFRFYRHADLDLNFAVRAQGWRAVAVASFPAVRHEHRGWSGTPESERERLSRRNFYRFLKHWRDRRDLLLAPDESAHHHHG